MMKKLVLIFSLISFSNGNAQNTKGLNVSKRNIGYLQSDTIPKVVYPSKWEVDRPITVLNGTYTATEILNNLDSNLIDSIKIKKENITINEVEYHGKIFVKSKSGYKSKLIKVNDLMRKYTNLKNKIFVFSIDDRILNSDPI